MANAKLFTAMTKMNLLDAGINPKTGEPIRVLDNPFEKGIRKQLEVLDEQDAIRRYVWYNLPSGLTSELIERILYYRGKGAFFYIEENDMFYFLPFALEGNIDVYGRYMGITPLPFTGTTSIKDSNGKEKPWITGFVRTPFYNIEEDVDYEKMLASCVILKDYSEGLSQEVIPRYIVQSPVLDIMAETLAISKTALIANSGIKGLKVNAEDEASSVTQASGTIENAARTGQMFVPIIGRQEFQDLTGSGTSPKSEEFLLFLQSLDNYRLSLYGLKNGGLFQKKSHMLEAEQNVNDGNTLFAYQDGLTLRQNFCNMVNHIWGIGISCEPCEQVSGIDRNMDGFIGEESEQSGIKDSAETEDGGESYE